MKHKIIETIPINLDQTKEELEKIKKRDKELNFRAQKTQEYIQTLSRQGIKKIEELQKKLTDLNIPRFKEPHIQKLLDILPTKEEEVKSTLQGYSITLTKENAKKIADTIKEFEEQ
jgi:DNA-directed RNA polymerase subunit F